MRRRHRACGARLASLARAIRDEQPKGREAIPVACDMKGMTIEYKTGVTVLQTYTLKRLDSDYFEEEQ